MPWEVRTLDVWANGDGGWDINNSFRAGSLPVTVLEAADEKELLRALVDQGFLSSSVKLSDWPHSEDDDDDVLIYFEDEFVMEVGSAPEGDVEYVVEQWIPPDDNDQGHWTERDVYETEEEAQSHIDQAGHESPATYRITERTVDGGDWPVLQVDWSPQWWSDLPAADWARTFGVHEADIRIAHRDEITEAVTKAVIWLYADPERAILYAQDPDADLDELLGDKAPKDGPRRAEVFRQLAHAYKVWVEAGRPE